MFICSEIKVFASAFVHLFTTCVQFRIGTLSDRSMSNAFLLDAEEYLIVTLKIEVCLLTNAA